MQYNAFTIDRDYTDNFDGKNFTKPRQLFTTAGKLTSEQQSELKPQLNKKFRLYDDDGVLYFQGRITYNHPEVTGFEPLDNFGIAYGCTEVRLLETTENGGYRWEVL